jgi:NAD(P)-dependent dehydrogenase (short-subunit alcohol dehydrogenase family)
MRPVAHPDNNLPPLAGKVSLVTGSGRRTGRAIAERLARAGASVVLAARSEDEIEAAANAISSNGGQALAAAADITREEDAERLVAQAVERFGRLDHLVNAAGVYLTGPFTEFPLEDWRRTLDTYLTGAFLCCRAAARRMTGLGRGHIVNISSTMVEMALPGFEAYSAAKAGVEAFSGCLAASLAPHGVKVSVLVPGAIDAAGEGPDPERKLEREDVARAVLDLLTLPDHVHVPTLTLRTVK